jgi:hypothetical protein
MPSRKRFLNASEPARRSAKETGGRPPLDELNATMLRNLKAASRQSGADMGDYTKS